MKKTGFLRTLLALVVTLGSVSVAWAQEIEPNQPCDLAQEFGEVLLPFTVEGSLDPTDDVGDVDFYRFTGVPDTSIQVDLAKRSSAVWWIPCRACRFPATRLLMRGWSSRSASTGDATWLPIRQPTRKDASGLRTPGEGHCLLGSTSCEPSRKSIGLPRPSPFLQGRTKS